MLKEHLHTYNNNSGVSKKESLPPSIIIESRQYGAGLGYIESSDILAAIKNIKKEEKIIIATSCKCHAVLTSLKRSRNSQK